MSPISQNLNRRSVLDNSFGNHPLDEPEKMVSSKYFYIPSGRWSKAPNSDQNLIYPLFLTAIFKKTELTKQLTFVTVKKQNKELTLR